MSRGFITLSAVVITLVVAGIAVAAPTDREQVHLTPAGQAAAKAAVTRAADLGAGWTGGSVAPQVAPTTNCSGFNPKQSDLVEIGVARTVLKRPGTQIDTEVQVLKTSRMVQLDWQRTVIPAKAIPCLKEDLSRGLGSASLVSLTRSTFPNVAPLANVFRVVLDVPNGAGGTVRAFEDIVVVGKGQTEITLAWAAPYAAASVVRAAEVRLLRELVGRVRTA